MLKQIGDTIKSLQKKKSPVLIIQRVLRAVRDRVWVKQRRELGPWAAVRIQSAVRFHRWRAAMLRDIDKFLLEVEPRVRSPQQQQQPYAQTLLHMFARF